MYLKVDKDLFGSGLNPLEILVLSQIDEFNRTTGECYVTDQQFAKYFGVSEKTVSRAIKHLEELGRVKRETKNVLGGRQRHLFTTDKLTLVDETSTTDKMTFVNETSTTDKLSLVQQSNCPLYNGQNDLIKDNNKKEKEENLEPSFSLRSKEVSKEEPLPPIVHDRAYFAWLMKHPSGTDDDYRAYLEREARN